MANRPGDPDVRDDGCQLDARLYPPMMTVAPGTTRDFVNQWQLEPHLVLGNPLTPPFPDGHEVAIFGMGCFWGADRPF